MTEMRTKLKCLVLPALYSIGLDDIGVPGEYVGEVCNEIVPWFATNCTLVRGASRASTRLCQRVRFLFVPATRERIGPVPAP